MKTKFITINGKKVECELIKKGDHYRHGDFIDAIPVANLLIGSRCSGHTGAYRPISKKRKPSKGLKPVRAWGIIEKGKLWPTTWSFKPEHPPRGFMKSKIIPVLITPLRRS